MVLLVTATPWEAAAIERRRPRRTGRSGRGVSLRVSGIGGEAAARTLAGLGSADELSLIVSCGFAGAVEPDLATGDLVADVRGLDAELAGVLRETAARENLRLVFGPVGHADKVLSAEDKRRLSLDPASRWAAVDMETSAVRRWSEARGLPCLALRSVLDRQSDELPSDWPEGPGATEAARYVLSHLGSLGLLLKVWRMSSKASDSLSRGLEAFLEGI